jgi:ABC-2 type transport system permease protein
VVELPSIYRRLVVASLRSQAQYRFSFVLQVIGAVFLSVIDFLGILVIFQHLARLGGWTLSEIGFLYGTSYVSFKIADLLIGQIDDLPQYIRTGRFDSFLIRPLGSLFQMFSADFHVRHIGGLLQGLVVLVYSLMQLSVTWDVGRGVLFVMMLIGGSVIFISVFVLANTISFWVVESREMANAFTYGGNELTVYPLHIFGAWIRRFAIFVVPLAFVNYFPAIYILDKPNVLHVPQWVSFASPLVAGGFAWVAARVWNVGVRHYRSTGS